MDVMNAERKKLSINSSFVQHEQYSQHVMENQKKLGCDSTNVCNQNQNISYSTNVAINDTSQIEKLNNKTALKLQKSGNEKMLGLCVKNNIKFERILCIKIVRCDLEIPHHLKNVKPKLQSSTKGII